MLGLLLGLSAGALVAKVTAAMAAQTHFINVFIVLSCHYSSPDFSAKKNGKFFSNPQNLRAIHSEVDCVNESFAHGLTLREEGQMEFSGGRRPTDLARAPPCPPSSPWRLFVDDGRSHEHNRDRIRLDHSTVRFRFDPTRQDPPPTQSATQNFTAVHMMP